jgi:hypothetical protein
MGSRVMSAKCEVRLCFLPLSSRWGFCVSVFFVVFPWISLWVKGDLRPTTLARTSFRFAGLAGVSFRFAGSAGVSGVVLPSAETIHPFS